MGDDAARGVIWALSACNFVIGMGAFVVIGLIDPVASGLDVSRGAAGALMTVYAISYALLSPVLVSTAGQLGRRKMLALGLTVFAAGTALCALAPNLATLYAGRALAAAGAGMFTPVSAAVAAALSAPERRGKALAAVVFGLTLAQVAGVPAGSWIAFTFGWRAAFWLVLALALLGILVVWTRVPRGLRFTPVSLADLGAVLRDGIAMGAVLFTASFLGAIYVLYTYLSPLLTETMGYRRDGITATLAVFGVGAVAGNVLGGWMADRIGSIRSLAILCGGLIVFMPFFAGLPYPTPVLVVLVFLWSLSGWSFMAAQQVRLLGLTPESASVILALNAAAIYVGTAVGSGLGTLALSATSLTLLGPCAAAAAVLALGHLLWSHRAARRAGREV